MTVLCYWLNYNGKEEDYGTLKPGEAAKQQTYVGHEWIYRNKANRQIVAEAKGKKESQMIAIWDPKPEAPLSFKEPFKFKNGQHLMITGGSETLPFEAGGVYILPKYKQAKKAGQDWWYIELIVGYFTGGGIIRCVEFGRT